MSSLSAISRIASRAVARSSFRMAGVSGARAGASAAMLKMVSGGSSGVRSFHVSSNRLQSGAPLSAADAELIASLKSEIKIEKEADLEEPSIVKSFLETSGFQLVTKDGKDEVKLVRKEGNEVIHVHFQVSDITNGESFLEDEESYEEQEEGATEEDEGAQFDEEVSTPIRLNVVIEKPKGALGIDAIVEQDVILVESIVPYESAELATSETPEADYTRRSQYQGPPFSVLDEKVQNAVEQFLESRGINGELAQFVTEYSSYRETNEYIAWLARVKAIVESE
ncbi:Mam33p [Sugiyamaella lignohabitans]|uniref:Mam33p n=1 Tax=Sugiyamaella lignohabitans TaxID=796027 RepID=A0A167DHD7_9ASCO|nr:Mam33p [Sugiyamaella lignohabitans]ANB12922.1 Mam33p [Sugiyamaella lignohabitans]